MMVKNRNVVPFIPGLGLRPALRQILRLLLLGACLLVVHAGPALAQSTSGTIPVIGYLTWWDCDSKTSISKHILDGLRDHGYEPGESVKIECRSAGQHDEGFVRAAEELVALGVDVIVSSSQPAARGAYQVTKSIPIVSIISGDPVDSGMAQSLSQPGGNLTGLTYYATELTGKRLELLKEAIPDLKIVDVLANPVVAYLPFERDTLLAAKRLSLQVRIHQVSKTEDLASAFSNMKANDAQAVFVLPDMMLAGSAQEIASLALDNQLPTMTWGYWFAEAGCMLAYSTWYPDLEYRLAFYVDKILKGAKPGDLPIEQPSKFVLSINLKTAKALNIEMPQTLLFRANNFIE